MFKKSYLFLAIVAIAAVFALSACGSNNNNNANNAAGSPSASAPSSSAAAGGQTQNITIQAKSFEFTPNDIQVHVGDTVNFTLQNTDGNHGFEIPDMNVNLKNGESATVTFDKAGTYDFNCSIQCGSGHDNMTGTITVS